ncbi:MAG TPA: hypothetical protein VLF66_10815 [Thermoanaerobaculia bacterium]|nr:hypothetical protein [Thermoanaerobaculia bacterium]
MSPCGATRAQPESPVEHARTRVANALLLVESAARALQALPGPEAALEAGDPELFRYLRSAHTALGWLVGHGKWATAECPGSDSAFGDGLRIFCWSDEQTERHFAAALQDWRKRP